MKLSNCKKILIIRLSSLGDILLTTPVIRTIKNLYPQIDIDFIVRAEYEDLLRYNPYINGIISLKRNYDVKSIRNELIKNKYDLIIDLQNNIRSRVLTKFIKTEIVRYKKQYLDRFLLVKFKINRFKEVIPIPVRYANSVPNFELDSKGLDIFLPQNLQAQLNSSDKYIGLCPGSKHQTKMWPEKHFVDLGNKLANKNYKIVLFGGRDDKAICSRISKQVSGALDFSNDNKLFELVVNMKKCITLICNDSGMMHTGLAAKLPVIAIFGSTVKELGFFPYKGENLVLENNSLSCRPCSHIGLQECPKQHLKCMNDILPSYVYEKTIKFIEEL